MTRNSGPKRAVRAIALLGATATLAALTSCSGSSTASPPHGSSPANSAAGQGTASGQSNSGLHTVMPARPTGAITPPPNGPDAAGKTHSSDLSAVVTAAKLSISSVVQLHDIAVSAGRHGRIPAAAIPSTAKSVGKQLNQQAAAVTKLKPNTSSPQAKLAGALDQFATLADTLARWNPGKNHKLPAAFFAQLESADSGWKAAMQTVGQLANEHLLNNVPKLLLPA